MTPFTIRQLTAHIGAEVIGLKWDDGDFRDDIISALRTALLRYKVLFFRGANLTPTQQVRFSRRFGTLTPAHPLVGGLDEEHPEVLLLDSAAYTLGVGSKTDGTSYNNRWHTDVTFSEEPPMGSLLSARVLPAVGGDTLWADLGAAHDALSAPLRAMLAGMHASHDAAGAFPKGRGGERAPVVHPVVREHPETKRRCLFVNPVFTKHIIGVSEAESKALLGLMYEIMIEPERVVRWNWQQGDLAFWDNRCTAHYAVADYSERRIMHRTTVAGEKPFPPQRQ